jgi:UV excision repair protein RAD23
MELLVPQIIIKNLNGTSFKLDLNLEGTVENVKQKIQDKFQHHVDRQTLIHSGRVLSDQKSLGEYDVKSNDFIVLMVKNTPKG